MTSTVAPIRRDAVIISGPEAAAYLQGQASQDILAIDRGASAWSWILQPAGKVDALVRVSRTSDETYVLDTDAGSGEALCNRLTRFKLRTRAEITLAAWEGWALRGPGALESAGRLAEAAGAQALSAPALWSTAEEAADVLAAESPESPDGWERVGPEVLDAARICAGVPAMGAELTERTIPAETGLVPLTVSFTKGCYTGQELVARIDSRGSNVARHLRLLRADEPLVVGAEVTAEGRSVGTLTSVAYAADGTWVALGYLGRATGPGAAASVAGADGRAAVPVHVEALPPRS